MNNSTTKTLNDFIDAEIIEQTEKITGTVETHRHDKELYISEKYVSSLADEIVPSEILSIAEHSFKQYAVEHDIEIEQLDEAEYHFLDQEIHTKIIDIVDNACEVLREKNGTDDLRVFVRKDNINEIKFVQGQNIEAAWELFANVLNTTVDDLKAIWMENHDGLPGRYGSYRLTIEELGSTLSDHVIMEYMRIK